MKNSFSRRRYGDGPVYVAMILVCLLASDVFAAAPKVRKGHPRIYITAEKLQALRFKCTGPMRGAFAAMGRAEWIMSRRAGTTWSDRTNVAYPAFMHLVFSKLGQRKYLDKTKEFLEALSRNWPKNQYLTPEWLRGGAMAADWIWNDITIQERARYG